MTEQQRKRLEAAGWKFGSAAAFLDLTPDEAAMVEIKLALARTFRRLREQLQLTQEKLAKHLHSSQSRVAKMEAADPSVSLDLLVHALLNLGVGRDVLARVISVRRVEDADRVAIQPRVSAAVLKELRAHPGLVARRRHA